ncbi:MAG TPA: hypothetical protein VKA09_01440, partial [Nitrososphaeraceae archaeon]|nr:hypothetical protein [Nitrososphaeraceae archaeon]
LPQTIVEPRVPAGMMTTPHTLENIIFSCTLSFDMNWKDPKIKRTLIRFIVSIVVSLGVIATIIF